MIALLKSDRFGMEIIIKNFHIKLLFSVKIRPFRYGNNEIDRRELLQHVLLKSDRFGMEILF